MKIFYLAWLTWTEGKIETPWDFWVLNVGFDYKPRKNSTSSLKPSLTMVQTAFDNQDVDILEEIEREFVRDMKLCAFLMANNMEDAQSQITKIFKDAEFERTAEVDEPTKIAILELITATVA
jgi:hypothetical protein